MPSTSWSSASPPSGVPRGVRRLRGGKRAKAGPIRRRPKRRATDLRSLFDAVPDELRRQALTHSSWTRNRADSYGRLAFLGDSVLGLAVAEHLFERFPRADIGRLTKVHGQTVSGRACAEVAVDLGLPALLRNAAPADADGGISPVSLLESERALASICEAAIGACYLHHGNPATAAATVAAFEQQIELASERLLDFKSALQELLAREGSRVTYAVASEAGPPHDRRFEVVARIGDREIGRGEGKSKKAAEQAAASEALERRRR
jgi:ribonuclease-3